MAQVYDYLNSRPWWKDIGAYIEVVLGIMGRPESGLWVPGEYKHFVPSQPETQFNRVRHQSTRDQER